MNKKWMPITAGILEILAGFWMFAAAYFTFRALYVLAARPWDDPSLPILMGWMIPFAVGFLGIMPLVGGVYALLRRRRRLAFAGAIATVPLFFVAPFGLGSWANLKYGIALHYFFWLPLLLSIAIITFIVLSKREFK